ncbi:MAG: hypothetical protein KatS3mg089_0957 [Patescibacteria group bacterium]|nr:MAG: hypothetical protein KatS3mg089_0957 [Patescibacteria group bacterium]
MIKSLSNKRVFLFTLVFTLVFVLLQIYSINYRLINLTIFSNSPLYYKLTLIWHLFIGYWKMFGLQDVLFNLITALLVGLNFALFLMTLGNTKRSGALKLSFGGGSFFALISTGCPSCGITLLSFLGPSASLINLFIRTTIVQLLIIGVLLLSLYSQLKAYQRSLICALPQKN